jgi:hypothetical protein
MIKVVLENEEEAEFDHATDLAEAHADVTTLVTRKNPLKASADSFSGLDKESMCEAATYEMKYGKEGEDIIVEANKQRQSVLNLENCWSPKDCCFKLLITLIVMSVVDMHQWHRHKTLALADAATRASSCITNSRQSDYHLRLREFSDMICVKLDKRKWNNHAQRSSRTSVVGVERDNEPLIRLRNKDGNSSRDPTVRQIQNGRTAGNTVTSNCFLCRKYLKENGKTAYNTTFFCCRKCNMPLCKLDRSGQEG